MSYGQSQQRQVASPPPPPASAAPPAAFQPPPPPGYPTRDGQQYPQNHAPVETKTRGDGFWKGCCAALCCCCVLDACF